MRDDEAPRTFTSLGPSVCPEAARGDGELPRLTSCLSGFLGGARDYSFSEVPAPETDTTYGGPPRDAGLKATARMATLFRHSSPLGMHSNSHDHVNFPLADSHSLQRCTYPLGDPRCLEFIFPVTIDAQGDLKPSEEAIDQVRSIIVSINKSEEEREQEFLRRELAPIKPSLFLRATPLKTPRPAVLSYGVLTTNSGKSLYQEALLW